MGDSIQGDGELMGRLTRHLMLICGLCMLLPGMALAQAIQNSATGELNTLSLDLSRATVALNRAGTVDSNNSSVTVSQPIVVADGNASSTITVTLRDGNNLPLAGRVVSLASSRGALDTLTQPINPTDINGVTTGEIRSSLNGIAQVLATDVADSLLLTDQPQVLFTRGEILQLTKTVNPDRATVGDIVTYTVAIQNTTTSTVSAVRIVDAASPVLSYARGTARLDGDAIADPLPGRSMLFDIGDILPLADTNGNGIADPGEGGYRTLSYTMIVGAGARVGSYGNRAVAIDVCDSCTISAPASVDLEITADPMFDLGTVIGKVFHDIDGDGWQDQGDTGIRGAMVVLDNGTYALTDAYGRYHFPAIRPGQRMVKLNLNSIAPNARATDSDKKVLSVTPGLLGKANFGVDYDLETESIGSEAKFGVTLDSADVGRGTDTTIALPLLQLIRFSGTRIRPSEEDQSRTREIGPIPSNAEYDYSLVGKTDIGNHVELDNKTLETDATGHFETLLELTPGRNTFVLSLRNAKGSMRYAKISIMLTTDHHGVPIFVVQPIPNLVLQHPTKGMAMRSANLALPGVTDPGNSIKINGEDVEIDENGHFLTSLPLRPGTNSIVTTVTDRDGYTGEIKRDIEYAGDGLFIMALADGKVSQIRREGNLLAAGADKEDEVLTEGRVALYLKGTVLGKYLITAAFDSGASDVDKIFSEIDSIENDRLVTNLDPDTIYPVYGDDSTLVYDAESQGKLYLALEGEQLDAIVGNYALNFTDTELTAYQRTLYGARAAWRSKGKTDDGKSNTEADLFVAQVDQMPVRDEIAATGGSLYFLSQNEIIQGSEQVSLLVHDQHTGLLLKRITQQRNVDYNIKYKEGRIWFTRPISSVIADGTLIGSNLLAGNPVSIQVDYEMPVDRLGAGINGARFKQRFAGGLFNIGGIHVEDDGKSGKYTLDGMDMEFNLQTARIVAEYAQSEGRDSLVFRSDDGGLQFSPVIAGTAQDGSAYKLTAEFDAGAWFGSPGRLLGSAYYKHLDAGFTSNGNISLDDNRQYGAVMNFKLNDRNSLLLRIDDLAQGQTTSSTQTSLNWRHSRDRITLEGEYFDRQVNTPDASSSAFAVRAQYDWTNSLTASLEHQQTISGIASTQSAAGVEYTFRNKLLLSGRVVSSADGEAFQGGASWDTPFGRLYAQQQLVGPEASDDSGSTVLGAETPFGAAGTVYTEYQWDRTGERRGLRSITGIRRDWSVTDGLTLLVSGEKTSLQAPGGGENEQYALIGGASFDRNGIKFSTRNEWRRQRGSTSLDQFATFNYGELKMSSGFTLLGEYRKNRSDNMLQQDQSTNFEEMSLGFAVRPTEHDRWNVLFKIASLDSDATQAQIDPRYDNSAAVLISTDWSVQLHRRIEWVGKQAVKKKLTEMEDLSRIETNTSLSIQRLIFDIPWNLSVGTEYRRLYQKESDDIRSGWLGEVMWNGIEHVGLGLGYNFTDFSSDLRFNSDYSEYGWFLRVQGRY